MLSFADEDFTDVVELPSLKRNEGERKYKMQAFGQEIDLDLHRTTGLLPETLPVHVFGEDAEGNPTIDDWTHSVRSSLTSAHIMTLHIGCGVCADM